MFGEAKGSFRGFAAVLDTADITVATSAWNAVFKNKKVYLERNQIECTFDHKKSWNVGY